MVPASLDQSEAVRRHERRLEVLKRRTLQRFPCVSATEFAELCHGEQELDAEGVMQHWRRGRLIGVNTDSGPIFPVFQIDSRTGKIFETLPKALAYFHKEEKAGGWPVYLWFATPRPYLDEQTPAECLQDEGRDLLDALQYEDGVAGG